MKVMASGPITSWQIAGETMDTVRDFIWGFPKLRYFGHLMQRVDSLEKTLMLGRIGAGGEGVNRGGDGWMASPTRWT